MSFWDYLTDAKSADVVTLARSLRHLHSVSPPAEALIAPVEPFERFETRLSAANRSLETSDVTLLINMRDGLAARWRTASFELDTAVLHGDARMDNLLVTPEGRSTFIDPERVCQGPPEWDLTLTALYYEIG